ncbi:hypothetical protein B0J14DRAFT_660517 [Halenospora varia]|nr:hypothetical protein B0J14DRAFT_660517 [Halenospora varia]
MGSNKQLPEQETAPPTPEYSLDPTSSIVLLKRCPKSSTNIPAKWKSPTAGRSIWIEISWVQDREILEKKPGENGTESEDPVTSFRVHWCTEKVELLEDGLRPWQMAEFAGEKEGQLKAGTIVVDDSKIDEKLNANDGNLSLFQKLLQNAEKDHKSPEGSKIEDTIIPAYQIFGDVATSSAHTIQGQQPGADLRVKRSPYGHRLFKDTRDEADNFQVGDCVKILKHNGPMCDVVNLRTRTNTTIPWAVFLPVPVREMCEWGIFYCDCVYVDYGQSKRNVREIDRDMDEDSDGWY